MIIKFVDLLDANSALGPAEQQQLAADHFSSVVENSHMTIWRPGEELPTHADQTWIAIASYSLPDLQILDALEAKLASKPRQNQIVVLFDLSSFPEFKDFERYLPGIGRVYQTPVIGHWEDGVLKDKASGAEAKNWLLQQYDI